MGRGGRRKEMQECERKKGTNIKGEEEEDEEMNPNEGMQDVEERKWDKVRLGRGRRRVGTYIQWRGQDGRSSGGGSKLKEAM